MCRGRLRIPLGPFSLHPTVTTAKGTVVKLTSRDCCPYLDDFEPDYLPAVAAIAPEDNIQYLGTQRALPSLNHRQRRYT